jgi:aspartyl/asparaginyl-tRNA synthetase
MQPPLPCPRSLKHPPRVLTEQLRDHVGSRIRLCGFVHAVRDQRRTQFVILRDPSGFAQIAHAKSFSGDSISKAISALTQESAISITGRVVDAPAVKLGGLEIQAEAIEVHGLADTPLPIAEDSGQERRTDWRALSLRRSDQRLVFVIQTTFEHAMRAFWRAHDFVFVTDYPAKGRPFYHMRHQDRPDLTKGFDLLWKGIEITTGAQREHRYGQLVGQVRERGYALEPLQYYLNFFRYGCPPHGGMGVGLGRLLMVLLQRPSIRDVTLLSRTPNRLRP